MTKSCQRRGKSTVDSHNFDAARRMLRLSGQRGRCRTSCDMTRSPSTFSFAAFAALSLLLAGPALAQQERSSGNFLDNLFSRGEPPAQSRAAPQPQPQQQPQPQGRVAQSDPGDMAVRLDRMEGALRQLTGTIEQLQYRNQQLELQLKRMQDDTEYRFQQMGGKRRLRAVAITGRAQGDRLVWDPVWRPAARRLPPRPVAVPTCSIRRKIRLRRARRAPWETRRQSRRPNRGRTMGHRSGPRVAAPPVRRSI